MRAWSWTESARATTLCLLLLSAVARAAEVVAPPAATPVPAVAASRYLLVDQASGWWIAGHEAGQTLDPGSLARLMTVYLALEQLRFGPETPATAVQVQAVGAPGAQPGIYLHKGDRTTLGDLVKAVAVVGAVDAAHALAAELAASESLFVDRMNAAALALGMKDTRFVDPAGGHEARSSLRDLARLVRRLANVHPEAFAWFAQRDFEHAGMAFHNPNPLLWQDDSADGVAVGTDAAGRILLLASATREGRRVIALVAGSASDAEAARDAARLLDYGFRVYDSRPVVAAGAVAARIPLGDDDGRLVPVGLKDDLYACVPRGTFARVFAQVAVRARVDPPVERGAELGQLTLRYGGRELLTEPLVALRSEAPRQGWWDRWFH